MITYKTETNATLEFQKFVANEQIEEWSVKMNNKIPYSLTEKRTLEIGLININSEHNLAIVTENN